MRNELVKISGEMVHSKSVQEIVEQTKLVHNVFKTIMIKDLHYGIIPGTKKNTLYKPGAEILALLFNLSATYEKEKTDLPDNHREYEVTCKLVNKFTGIVWGEGVGSCSTMEAKYRYRNSEQKCPECEKDTIIKGKKQYGGGWLCYQKKGGCGAKFQDGDKLIENQNMGKVEHEDPADYYNTVLKMSKKRSFNDAVITSTAASDIFEQTDDLPDFESKVQEPSKYDADIEIIKERETPGSETEGVLFKQPAEGTYAERLENIMVAEFANDPEGWRKFLKEHSEFTNKKNGEIVPGKESIEELTLPRQKVTYGKIQSFLDRK